MPMIGHTRRDSLLILVFTLLSVVLYFLPTGFAEKVDADAVRCTGLVTAVDDSGVSNFGLIRKGGQGVELDILDGPFRGRHFDANNQLLGRLDRDKLFKPGDKAYVVITVDKDGEPIYVNPQDHYRLGLELLLLLLFGVLVVAFGGLTGIKALLSFVFTGLVLWKVLIPLLLKGVDPVWLTMGIVSLLCAVIIFLVAGVNRVGLTSFFGSFLGVLTSCILGIYFTHALHVHGAVMPFAETLLYSGYSHLDLVGLFIAAVFLASSGAFMDLSMDVAASMGEIMARNPELSRGQAIRSGLRVGRAVVGTMTTTLLLAYSGGFVTLLMAFMAQGIPLDSTFNFIYVGAEVLKTLVGSFGLVTVAPFTAVVGGLLIARGGEERAATTSRA